MPSRRLLITLAGAAALAIGAVALAPRALAAGGVEEPSFEIVARHDDFEVRRYAPRIVAETTVLARPGEAGRAAFSILAGYIGGHNRGSQKISMTAPVETHPEIAMTAPVTAQRQADGRTGKDGRQAYVVTFTMPAKWTMQSLPTPEDPRVKLRRVERQTLAVIRFSGRPGPTQVDERKRSLLEAVRAEGYTPTSTPAFAQYDPPWTPAFMRRNEVWVELGPTAG